MTGRVKWGLEDTPQEGRYERVEDIPSPYVWDRLVKCPVHGELLVPWTIEEFCEDDTCPICTGKERPYYFATSPPEGGDA